MYILLSKIPLQYGLTLDNYRVIINYTVNKVWLIIIGLQTYYVRVNTGILVPVLWYLDPARICEIAIRTRDPPQPLFRPHHWCARQSSLATTRSFSRSPCRPLIEGAALPRYTSGRSRAPLSSIPLRFSILLNVAPFLPLDHVHGTI